MDAVKKRKIMNVLILALSTASAIFGILALLWILGTLIEKGFSTISIEVFTGDPPSPGEESGGLKHAIIGQLLIVSLATVIGIPLGILAGTYLSEYRRDGKLAKAVREIADVMTSVPSIVLGTFVYAILVKPAGHFMGIAGSLSLAIMMLPIVMRTTEDMLRMVPPELKESAYALGATRFRMIVDVAYRSAITGIATGAILAVARIGGETAPLLFTSFNNNFLTFDMTQPMASLTVTMYDYAMSPYKYWQELAWASAVILTAGVLGANILARLITRYRTKA